MSGDWGALLLQFAITAVVVLGLIGIAFWLVRRYSTIGIGRIGRGRVPRLAIMDAMSVDGRRRLVLVRRDNVEHLILIGGPTDVVVEQAIQRPRRPKAAGPEADAYPPGTGEQPQQTTPPPPAAATPLLRSRTAAGQNGSQPSAGSEQQPFSFRRTSHPAAPSSPPAIAARTRTEDDTPAPAPARYIDVNRPTRIEAPAATPAPLRQIERQPEDSEPLFPDLPTADVEEAAEDRFLRPGNGGDPGFAPGAENGAASPPPATPSPYAKPPADADETRGKLADLENEMARLLGEITQKRHS